MDFRNPSDLELLARTGAGDSAAFEILHGRYKWLIFSACLRLLRDPTDAEEVTQEVFIRVWRRAVRYNAARGNPATWLLTITRRLTIDHVRRRQGHAIPSSPDVEAVMTLVSDDLEDVAVSAEFAAQVRRAMQRLIPEQQQVLWLAYFAGHTQREIAVTLRIPLGTVKGRLRLGLHNLRRLLGESVHRAESVGDAQASRPAQNPDA